MVRTESPCCSAPESAAVALAEMQKVWLGLSTSEYSVGNRASFFEAKIFRVDGHERD
jgi:hypothetical protein